jgi:hypothetical protein
MSGASSWNPTLPAIRGLSSSLSHRARYAWERGVSLDAARSAEIVLAIPQCWVGGKIYMAQSRTSNVHAV